MPRILIIGDVHDEQARLAEVLELVVGERFELVLLPGDVGRDPPWREPDRSRGRREHDESIRRVIDRVRTSVRGPIVFVPGNHDLPQPSERSGGVNADGLVVEAAGLRIVGLGGAGPHHYGFPYEWSEIEAQERLDRLSDAIDRPIDVFLSHAPPASSRLDRTAAGAHVGSRSVDRFIDRIRPGLFVCGHIHEACGVESRYGVPCLNAGALGEPHGQSLAFVVDWQAGPRRIRRLRRGARGEVEDDDWTVG